MEIKMILYDSCYFYSGNGDRYEYGIEDYQSEDGYYTILKGGKNERNKSN